MHQKRQILRERERERERERAYWPFHSEQLGKNRGERWKWSKRNLWENQVGRVRVEADKRFKKVKP